MRDGSVRNVHVSQGSGNQAVDYSAQRAIYDASPFPPLPAAYERNVCQLRILVRVETINETSSFVYCRAAGLIAGLIAILPAQQPDAIYTISGGDRPKIAIPDLRGSGAAQPLMNAFNETLYNDLDASGLFKMVPKPCIR